jgi:hypothetical protein
MLSSGTICRMSVQQPQLPSSLNATFTPGLP